LLLPHLGVAVVVVVVAGYVLFAGFVFIDFQFLLSACFY